MLVEMHVLFLLLSFHLTLHFLSPFADGKCVACTFGAKFIEVSAGINHNCDDLLAGTLTQIRLKKDQNLLHVSEALKCRVCAVSVYKGMRSIRISVCMCVL